MPEDKPIVLVISRFASTTNQRLSHLLQLSERGFETYLVCEPHGRPERQTTHINSLPIKRRPHPFSVIERILSLFGLNTFKFRVFPAPAQRSYNKALLRTLLRFIKSNCRQRIYIIITTPPHHLALISSQLKNISPETRIIIDWQDLWTADEYYASPAVSSDRLVEFEAETMSAAHANVFTNEFARTFVRANNSRSDTILEPTFAIEHAFEGGVQEFKSVVRPTQLPEEAPLEIGFLGSFFKPPKVPGDLILETFERLAELEVNFVLNIIGERAFEDKKGGQCDRWPWLITKARMPHEAALKQMRKYDWLLLTLADLPSCRNIMHIKLVSYIQIGVPILAIVARDSFCASIIEKYQVGVVVPPGPELAERISDALCNWEPSSTPLPADRNELCLERFLDKWETVLNSI